MSVEAISWALAQPIKHSTAKFVLVVMANHADAEMKCWPSTVHLCEQTSQDRKTVAENLRRLREWGYIVDTGERKGLTKQVTVYQLKTPEIGPIDDAGMGGAKSAKQTENGTVKDSQKRNYTENGTVPFFPANRPNFPMEQAQFSHETGPKTGHGTVNEPSIEPSGNRQLALARSEPKFDPMRALLDAGVRRQIAKDWLAIRKAKRAPLTLTALEGIQAEAVKAGMTLAQAVQIACESGWQGFKASWLKSQHAVPAARPTEQQLQAVNEEAYRLAFGNRESEVIDV